MKNSQARKFRSRLSILGQPPSTHHGRRLNHDIMKKKLIALRVFNAMNLVIL